MKKLLSAGLLTFAMICVLVLAACGEKEKTIRIGHSPYDYELPAIEVTRLLAEELGYETEIVEGDIGFMFAALESGDTDIWPGVWLPSIHVTYEEKYGDKYEKGSAIFEDAPIGWAVPEYVEEINSIEDIKGNEALFDRKIYGLEPGAGMMIVSEQIIEAYDLDLELQSGSTASMLAEAEYAVSQNKPVLLLGWRPHAMIKKYGLKILEETRGYWERDSQIWGINKDFREKAPEIYSLVKNMKISLDDHEDYLLYVEAGGDGRKWAENWIDKHREEVDSWLGK